MQSNVVIHTQKHHACRVGWRNSNIFLAMHYWISAINVLVSNPKANKIDLSQSIHFTGKKSFYQHIFSPPPFWEGIFSFPPTPASPLAHTHTRRKKKVIDFTTQLMGVLNIDFHAVGVSGLLVTFPLQQRT